MTAYFEENPGALATKRMPRGSLRKSRGVDGQWMPVGGLSLVLAEGR